MERLKQDLVQLNKALDTLREAFEVAAQLEKLNNPLFVLTAEDSIIKRFEYSYETFWKFLKKYLEHMHHLEDINSPKKVFRAAVKVEVCSFDEGDIFIDMSDDRNETSHKYDLESMRIILPGVQRYYGAMVTVASRLGQKLGGGFSGHAF